MHGSFVDRMYSLKVTTGADYPGSPPTVTFIEKVNLPGVNEIGQVDISQLGPCSPWNPVDHTIKHVLSSIKNMMNENRAVEQPEEGTKYAE